MDAHKLIEEQPELGKAVMLLVDDDTWRCYIWQGDSWQRFDDHREPQPDDRWRPLPRAQSATRYHEPT